MAEKFDRRKRGWFNIAEGVLKMMKNNSLVKSAGFCLFAFFLIVSASRAASLKVGVVDIETIYASYGKAQETAEAIQDMREKRQIELVKKETGLQVLVDEYNRTQAGLKEAERAERLKRIREIQTEIKTFTDFSNERLAAENTRQMQARLNEIAGVIQKYARDNGYDVIIDKKSLPFFSDALNLTNDIIKILNK